MNKPIKHAAAEDRNPTESFLKTEGSLYRRRGMPERAWAEIKRAIFWTRQSVKGTHLIVAAPGAEASKDFGSHFEGAKELLLFLELLLQK